MACTSRNLAKAGPRFRRQSFEAGQAGVASCPCRMPRRVAAGAAPAAEAAAEAAADAENEHADEEDGVPSTMCLRVAVSPWGTRALSDWSRVRVCVIVARSRCEPAPDRHHLMQQQPDQGHPLLLVEGALEGHACIRRPA